MPQITQSLNLQALALVSGIVMGWLLTRTAQKVVSFFRSSRSRRRNEREIHGISQ